jgi:hypothetical protein
MNADEPLVGDQTPAGSARPFAEVDVLAASSVLSNPSSASKATRRTTRLPLPSQRASDLPTGLPRARPYSLRPCRVRQVMYAPQSRPRLGIAYRRCCSHPASADP